MIITPRQHIAGLVAAALAPSCSGPNWCQTVAAVAREAADAVMDELARVPAPYHCHRRGCGKRIEDGRVYCDEHRPPQLEEMEEFRRRFAENMRLRHLAEQERAQAEAARPVQLTPEQEAIVSACERQFGPVQVLPAGTPATVAQIDAGCETFMGGGAVAVSAGTVQGMTVDGQPVPRVEVREDDGHTD